jgi:oxygen-dependent protoporphyrinogen oxidase
VYPDRSPDGEALFRVFYGGATDARILDTMNDDDFAFIAGDEIGRALGYTWKLRSLGPIRWERGIPHYTVGHSARIDAIETRVATHAGQHLAGNSYRGVGLNQVIENARALAASLLTAQ